MCFSLSKLRRRRNRNQDPFLPSSSVTRPPPPPSPPPLPVAVTASTDNAVSDTNTNIDNISNDPMTVLPNPPLPPPPQPPALPPSSAFAVNAPRPCPPFMPYSSYNPQMPGFNYYPSYYPNQPSGWTPIRPPVPMRPSFEPSPPYVDHKSAKKIKNDVNVHKDSIKVFLDDQNLDSYLVSFTFDAVADGSITVFYFAKEGDNCTFMSQYPEIYMPRRIPFQKGSGQKFSQPSGTGIDLGFFESDELSKHSAAEDIFPLIIFAETSSPSSSVGAEPDQALPTTFPHAQVTQAVLVKNNEGQYLVRVVKQKLWVDGICYELREIYGISNSSETGFDDSEPGKECVICMTEPKNTAVLPCRHMCMCRDCAKALRLQSNKCPICRQPIQELMEIKADEESS